MHRQAGASVRSTQPLLRCRLQTIHSNKLTIRSPSPLWQFLTRDHGGSQAWLTGDRSWECLARERATKLVNAVIPLISFSPCHGARSGSRRRVLYVFGYSFRSTRLIEARQGENLAGPQPRKAQVMLKFWTVAVVAAFVSTSAIAAPASRVANHSMVTKCDGGCPGNEHMVCEQNGTVRSCHCGY